MTRGEKQERLKRYRKALRWQKETADEAQRLEADRARCRKLFCHWRRDLPEYSAIINNEIRKLETERLKLERFCRQIEGSIAGLPDKEKTVLALRYLEGLTWEKTAEKMNYSSMQAVYKIHARALDMMEDQEK